MNGGGERSRAQRLSAGTVVVHETAEGPRLLMLRAYRNWDFPKGGVESGEDPLAAAIRETREETGIEDLDFAYGHEHIDTGPYAGGKVARYFVARTQRAAVVLPVSAELGRPEHHEYRWVDIGTALALAPPRVKPVVEWAATKIGLARVLLRSPKAPTQRSADGQTTSRRERQEPRARRPGKGPRSDDA